MGFYDPFDVICVPDATIFKEHTERKKLYKLISWLNSKFDQIRQQILEWSHLPKLQGAFSIVQHVRSHREVILHRTVIETAVRVGDPVGRGSICQPHPVDLVPDIPSCDHCGRIRHT